MAYFPLATEVGARYVLTAPDGSTAVFNDPTDASYVGMMTNVSGLDGAEVRESSSDLVEADGGTHGAFYMGRRPITLEAKVFGHLSIPDRNLRVDRARRASLALRGDANLSWKPSWRRDNFALNGDSDVDLANIYNVAASLTAGASITRSTAQFQVAPASVQAVTTAANQGVAYGLTTLVAGTTYSVSFWLKGNAGGETLDFYVWTSDSSGNFYGPNGQNSTGNTGPLTTGWRNFAFEFTPSSTLLNPRLVVRTISPAALTFFADTAQVRDYVELYVPVRRNQPFRESGGWVKDLQLSLVSEYSFIFGAAVKNIASGVATENRGNVSAFPLLNMSGIAVDPTASDGTRTFRTTGLSLAPGETVQFDMLNHTGVFTSGARVGQSANRYINFATTQWLALPGLGTSQTFTVSAGGLSIAYRDTWA